MLHVGEGLHPNREQFASRIETEVINEIPAGSLDGFTLFRFAHIFRSSSAGGVEGYLRDLNRHLLERNELRILQMYLSLADAPAEVEIQKVGRGELIWIPSFLKNTAELQLTKARQFWYKLRTRLICTFLISHEILLKTLQSYTIDLAAFHWISEDSIIVLRYLNKREIPFVVINHFQNARLKRRIAKKYISKASAIGGVSDVDVPSFVDTKFTNLSDGVDTEFYKKEKAVPLGRKIEKPLIVSPSRVTEGKGHLDAVRALGWLVQRGHNATLAFAGRVESASLLKILKELIGKEGLDERVMFLGELEAEDLRNWYGASDLVLLTSYSEGLGRVLLEAQAMKIAVLAYDVGGVAQAIKNGESGYLVRRGDIEGLGRRLKDLLANKDKRCQMGERGREFVIERFALRSLVIRHEKFYAEALRPIYD
jgi:glycosyltransferase involved in cell wall biosynthesis